MCGEETSPRGAAEPATYGAWFPPGSQPGLFSIVIPTHNRVSLLLETLDSVAAQTYRPIEVVVVDDASTDITPEAVAQWAAQHADDPTLTVVALRQDPAGACAARNRGASASHGEYIQFLDSDDLLLPLRLERLVEAFRATGADYVSSGFRGFCGTCGEVLNEYIPPPARGAPVFQYATRELWVNTAVFALRRTVAERVGPWSTDLPIAQDHDFLSRLFAASDSFATVPEALIAVRRGGSARISDARGSHAADAAVLVGTATVRDALMAKHAPPHIRRAFSRDVMRIALRVSLYDADLGGRYAALARSVGARPVAPRDQLEMLAYHSGHAGRRLYAKALAFGRRAKGRRGAAGRIHVCS
jgi:glycosyltransferase involved in cell wall biosynthesis